MFNFKGDRLYNTYSKEKYLELFNGCKKNKEFNTLWFYRSILENENLSTEEKIEIRDLFNSLFYKRYEFLQVKDPETYMSLELLWKNYTVADKEKIWDEIKINQQKILKEKKIKHRNFGNYSRHNCWYKDCPFHWIMIKQEWGFEECTMHFDTDSCIWSVSLGFKSKLNRKERKHKNLLKEELKDLDY